MFSKIKAYLIFHSIVFFLFLVLALLPIAAGGRTPDEIGIWAPHSFTPADPVLAQSRKYIPPYKTMKELWNPTMAGVDCPAAAESPFIPLSYYADMGTRSFFIRGEKYFPIDFSKCLDLPHDRMGMAECLKRNGIRPEDLPPIKPSPNRVPPLPPDAERLFFSIRGEGRFKAPPRISPEGKVGHPAGEPSWWRAIALRLTPDFLQALEDSVKNYLSNQINTEANKICNPAAGSSYRYQLNSDETCTDLQNCGAASSGPSPCQNVGCPAVACSPSQSACSADPPDPFGGACANKDYFPCDTHGTPDCYVAANDNRCLYIQTPLGLQIADCGNTGNFNCSNPTLKCDDDGLLADVYVPKSDIEAFFRVVNYEPSPSDCNSTKIEKKCEPCGNETGCCPDSEFCGVVAWCWSPTDGCYCCDDRIRHHFWITDIAAYNLAYLVYGPNTSPFMTACYTKPPASSFDAGHPGEWIDLCACNQDVSFSDYDSEFCDWGICGWFIDFIENFQKR
jgi:hypothetical protein